MNIKIGSIADRGVPKKERLVLRILADTDIGEYAVFRTLTTAGGEVSTSVEQSYWFVDKAVSVGDQVILYTKQGTPSEKVLENGHTAHFFYWGHEDGVFWESTDYGAVLLHVDEWVAHIPDDA